MMWVPVVVVLAGACGGGDGTAEEPSASTAPQEQASAAPQAPSTETTDDDAAAGPRVYVVESGDTLSEIARRFDTTVEAIVRANDISDPDVIDVGQELEIPGS